MAEAPVHNDNLKAPATAHWHPLSPHETALEEDADSRPVSGYFGIPTSRPNSRAGTPDIAVQDAGATPQAASTSNNSSQTTPADEPPDFILMLPQAPHQMSYHALLKNLNGFVTGTSKEEAEETTKEEFLPAQVILPVISTLTKQLEETKSALDKSEAVRHSQIDSLKAVIEQQTPSVSAQVIERTLIRARAAATDGFLASKSNTPKHERPYSSRPWELHVGPRPPSAREGSAQGVTVFEDNRSIDMALDEAMSDSHLDLGFAAASTPKKDKSSGHKGRKRQTSLSARIFGGLVGGHASTSANERERHSSKESVPSTAVESDYNASMSDDNRPSSPFDAASTHQHQHQKRGSYLSDWASVLTWRSATKSHQRSSSHESADRSRSTAPEESPASQEVSLPPQQFMCDTTPTEANSSQPTLESIRSQSVSTQSSHSTTLGSTHPSVENRPTIESVLGRPVPSPSPAQRSFDEPHADKPSSPGPGTPSSAVRALLSKKQIEPPALSLPGARATSASASEASIPTPPSREGQQESSPGLALAPNLEDLPHEAGPTIATGATTEEPEALEEDQYALEASCDPSETPEHLSALPSPAIPKTPHNALSRSQSYSSQISRNSSNKDLPRSGSGYVSSMLNRTMAFVAQPAARHTPKRTLSAPGDSRVEPAVTLPSLGITKQGPVFQLAPASNSSNTPAQATTGASAPPPASMELTTIVSSDSRPPTFGGSAGDRHFEGMGDFVDRYGFLHEQNGMATLRELRQRQQDAILSPKVGSPNPAEEVESNNSENSVKRLLARLDDMDETDERRLRASWDAFLKRRRAQLAPNEPSTARKERANSLAQSVKAGGGAASLNSGFTEGDEDVWTENLIGVARLGTSGKEGKETWRDFKKLVRSGIPVRDRPAIWAELSGANDQREPGYYQELLANHEEGHDSLCLKQIEADVGRTFGTNVFFGGDGPGVAKLRRVLMAYSWHNPEVGYCQGMNLIAGSLLLALPTEEDAFWVLLCIIERILPSEYFTSTLLVSRADQRVLKDLVAKHLPKIHEHMEDVGIELEALSFGWFLSLFSMALPIRTLLRVLDVFFVDGSIVLFRITAAMLQIYAEDILACDNASDLYVFMRTMPSSVHQADRLITLACGEELRAIKTKDVVALREHHVAEMTATMQSPKAGKK